MPALSKHKKLFLLADLILLILLIALDQGTKLLAVRHLKDKPAISLIGGVLELYYLENTGAAFGMLKNQKIFFILIAIVIIAIIAYVLFLAPDDRRYNAIHILLVLIAGGAAGNMIDRFRKEYVVDFIYFVIINFPVFNVADIYVTVATGVLVILFLFYYKEKDFAFLNFKQQRKYRELK